MDEVPHEGRVAIPIEEYTIHAIKKGQAEITIAPNADLKFGDKFGINIINEKRNYNSAVFVCLHVLLIEKIQISIISYNKRNITMYRINVK